VEVSIANGKTIPPGMPRECLTEQTYSPGDGGIVLSTFRTLRIRTTAATWTTKDTFIFRDAETT